MRGKISKNQAFIFEKRPLQKFEFSSNSRQEWKITFELAPGNEEVNFYDNEEVG